MVFVRPITAILCGITLLEAGLMGAASPQPLETVQQIMSLENQAALKGVPVELKGIVVVQDHVHDAVYVNDCSGRMPSTVCVRGVSQTIPVYSLVVVTGVTTARFAPEVQAESIRVLDEGNRPVPARLALDQLEKPDMEAQWVDTEAMLAVWQPSEGGAYFELWGKNPIRVTGYMVDTNGMPDMVDVVNHTVRIAGVCTVVTNEMNQYRDLRIVVSRKASFGLPAPRSNRVPVPMDAETMARLLSEKREIATNATAPQKLQVLARDLLSYRSTHDLVRLRGVVTSQPWARGLYLQDDSGPAYVVLKRAQSFAPGDMLEVTGLPRAWEFRPQLLSAEAKPVGKAPVPEPIYVADTDVVGLNHDARRIKVQGKVIAYDFEKAFATSNKLAVVQRNQGTFKVKMQGEIGEKLFPLGSTVEVLGICELKGNPWGNISGFHVQVQNKEDIVIMAKAPPLDPRQIAQASVVLGTIGLLAIAWIALLKWQVRRQTFALQHANTVLTEEVVARERAESETRAALEKEKDLVQLKSNFISMVSHEFRTPLGVIQSSSDILQRYHERLSPEKRVAQMRSIRKAVRRMSDLMEEVLLLARFDNSQMRCQRTVVELTRLCRRCILDVEAATEQRCNIQFESDPPAFRCDVDENLFVHALLNLLTNAVKYSSPGGYVLLHVQGTRQQVKLTVRDQGCGIPTEDQPHLFSGFFRGSNIGSTPGSGLGLVIVKRCVDLHGGAVQVDSAEGRGTTLVVTLPVESFEAVSGDGNIDTELLLRSGFGNTEFLVNPPKRINPAATDSDHSPGETDLKHE